MVDQIEDCNDLRDHLVLRAEDMGIVLSETARAQQPVHRTRKLMTVYRAELEKAQRQIAIGTDLVAIDEHMTGAVHRLHAVFGKTRVLFAAFIDVEEVHVLAIKIVMARSLPNIRLIHMRRDDLFVATLVEVATQPFLEQANDTCTLGRIERQAHTRIFVEHEVTQFLAHFAMIALLRFCEIMQMRGKLLLLEERRAIQALKHLAL